MRLDLCRFCESKSTKIEQKFSKEARKYSGEHATKQKNIKNHLTNDGDINAK